MEGDAPIPLTGVVHVFDSLDEASRGSGGHILIPF